LEPLFDKELALKEPFLITHHAGMRLQYQFRKIGAEISQGFESAKNIASNPAQWLRSSFGGGSTSAQPVLSSTQSPAIASEAHSGPASGGLVAGFLSSLFSSSSEEKAVATSTQAAAQAVVLSEHAWSSLDPDLKAVEMNSGKRIDYVLQESPLEHTNAYMSALFSHSSYFENKDFAQ
jgi:hypothetical protein